MLGIVIMSVTLFGAYLYISKSNTAYVGPLAFIPQPQPPDKNKESLQLKKLDFIETTPIPTPADDFDCNYGQLSSSEPNILYAMDPAPGTNVGPEGSIKIWYNDEHALTLGKGNITPYNSSNHVLNPSIGDPTAKDDNGLPIYPSLFLSDITSDPNNRSGDAQNGGTPHTPDEIWGTWLEAGGLDPQTQNGTTLPPGSDPFPTESNIKFNDGYRRPREIRYGAEIIWNVNNLKLTPGHSYRAQFIIHDGDRLGDIGMGCTTIKL